MSTPTAIFLHFLWLTAPLTYHSHKNSHQKGKVNGCLVTLLARGKYLASECLTRQCAVKKTSANALKRRVNTNYTNYNSIKTKTTVNRKRMADKPPNSIS
ncbi:hypothetical protein [Symbiopectobacterium purcellii]|uniref:Secreted protein n=1 Tax=Symbiopectobacterium purcellii TaxID=2871826 RepID=A0ABX9AIX7_9ENTR|nr:hypothetical protein [Symbiopectobacterium purcellii]QZN95134.1 hypothetical protein K6K13_18205 [Symbiopectobacterium purcellii]